MNILKTIHQTTIRSIRYGFFLFGLIALFSAKQQLCAKPAEITYHQVYPKIEEIMSLHVSGKALTPDLMKRCLSNYLDILDPAKTYFIEPEIHQWIEPTDAQLAQIITDFEHNRFSVFQQMFEAMVKAIERRDLFEDRLKSDTVPTGVSPKEFRDMKWCQDENELYKRIKRIRGLQMESSSKLDPELREIALQRLDKGRLKHEEEILVKDKGSKEKIISTYILKAMASALDTHTVYFTPSEANQFVINVQQRLFGIGAQLRDDLNGFTIVKIVEGGPADLSKELKLKDRIVAVNGEPVVGMEITDAVDLIRGEEGTNVALTVIREVQKGDHKEQETKQITIKRGEVVIKESRVESSVEPYGDGVIAYLKLHSFYEDEETSSAEDLKKAFEKIKAQYPVKAVVLDLRFNAGGLLTQAVAVTSLFITKGIVVSIKDESSKLQHLRDLDGQTMWSGPLAVLINRASASASEIVAQTLQDYGRALIVGDDHSFGKGSFQTFTLGATKGVGVDPQGEYKVTRGRYYTVSGRSPQLVGVKSDIVVPSGLSSIEVGEEYAKHPLPTDSIKANYDDDLSDVPFFQRDKIRQLYHFQLQRRLDMYTPYIEKLKENSALRIANNQSYQAYLKMFKEEDLEEGSEEINLHHRDFQLSESYNVVRDLLYLMLAAEEEKKARAA